NVLCIVVFVIAVVVCGCRPDLDTIKGACATVETTPRIKPDFSAIRLPPNIAPLNFALVDSCTACVAEFSSVKGQPFTVWGGQEGIQIPPKTWKKLLTQNPGKPLRITVYAQSKAGTWRRYAAIEDTISAEPIDEYCTYRLLNYQYNYSSDLRECQRDLSTFDEKVLVYSQNYPWGCVNCHTPLNNDNSRFVLQIRSTDYGSQTLIADGDTLTTLKSRLGYAAWRPSGDIIAFSVYKVEQFFHAVGRQFIDVFDRNSSIVIYDVARRSIIAQPQLTLPATLETWPAWSADGSFLYFCSSPVLWSNSDKEPPENFNKTRYSLLRIGYDAAHKSWSQVDTVLSTGQTGLSIVQPKISPDNKFCLFGMQTFGAYPHSQVSSDLYLMDLATKQYRKLPINSEYNESWHCWSKNGRWILFSSKRGGGIFTRLYISYIDSAGNAGKPFVLPQRDPFFYDSFIQCYNVAELSVSPVRFSERRLLSAIKTKRMVSVPIPTHNTAPVNEPPPAWTSPPGNQHG
ncbi:MAG TPA: hypothetical protein VF335_03145, partial [Chitinivibrionales bacterium]